jgi:acetyltransferase-like isoleucine patch superfamily enzyme
VNRLSTLAARAARKLIVRPATRWYDTACVVELLRNVEQLGRGVVVNGRIQVGVPQALRLGDDVSLNRGFVVKDRGPCVIGDHVHFGEHVTLLTANHNFAVPEALPYDKVRLAPGITIGDSVWIGDHVIIVPGVHVGEGAILAAGAIVTRDVPALAVVGGSPARVLKERDAEVYRRLKEQGKFIGWPRDYDLVMGQKMHIPRKR